MRFSKYRKTNHSGMNENFDLNITPVIDCFTVLIAFVLVATSVASISIMQSEVSAQSSSRIQDPRSNVHIAIRTDHSIDIALTAGPNESAEVRGRFEKPIRISPRGPKATEPDYDQLLQRLAFIKGEWPELKNAVLVPDASIPYQAVIKSMEIARNAFSSISLGGM